MIVRESIASVRPLEQARPTGKRDDHRLRKVDIELKAAGRITGHEALWQRAAMPVGLTIGFTAIALIAVTV